MHLEKAYSRLLLVTYKMEYINYKANINVYISRMLMSDELQMKEYIGAWTYDTYKHIILVMQRIIHTKKRTNKRGISYNA